MDCLPETLRRNLLEATVHSNSELYGSVALDIAEFVANELKKIRLHENSGEDVKEKLASFGSCISRVIILTEDEKSSDLVAALLSVLLDVAFTRKELLDSRSEENDYLCTLCFFYLRHSPAHVLDVILQTDFLSSKDSGLVILLLQKLESRYSVTDIPAYLKLILIAKKALSLFETKDSASVYKMVMKTVVPIGVDTFLIKNRILSTVETQDDLTGYLLSSGVIDEALCERIFDVLASPNHKSEKRTEMEFSFQSSSSAALNSAENKLGELFYIDSTGELLEQDFVQRLETCCSATESLGEKNLMGDTNEPQLHHRSSPNGYDSTWPVISEDAASAAVTVKKIVRRSRRLLDKVAEDSKIIDKDDESLQVNDARAEAPTDPSPPLKMRLRNKKITQATERDVVKNKKARTMPSEKEPVRPEPNPETRSKARSKPKKSRTRH